MKLNQLVFGVCFLCLTGCSMFSPVKPPDESSYLIDSQPKHIPMSRTRHQTLLVLEPETLSPYDTQMIAYTVKPFQVSYYGLNKWSDRPQKMMLPLMVQALQKTHRFKAVVEPPFSGSSEYILNTRILLLQQNLMQHPNVVELVMRAELQNTGSNRVVAVKLFKETVAMDQTNPYSGVLATNRAMDKLLQELAAFCIHNT